MSFLSGVQPPLKCGKYWKNEVQPRDISKALATGGSEQWLYQALQERCPTSSAIEFAVKTFDFLLEQPSLVIAR